MLIHFILSYILSYYIYNININVITIFYYNINIFYINDIIITLSADILY